MKLRTEFYDGAGRLLLDLGTREIGGNESLHIGPVKLEVSVEGGAGIDVDGMLKITEVPELKIEAEASASPAVLDVHHG